MLTATRPLAGQCVREIYAFEIASSTEWAFQRLAQPFRPNVFVDVTRTLEAKIAAMECYESEARSFPIRDRQRPCGRLRCAGEAWPAVEQPRHLNWYARFVYDSTDLRDWLTMPDSIKIGQREIAPGGRSMLSRKCRPITTRISIRR